VEYQDDEFSNVQMKLMLRTLLDRLEDLSIDYPEIFAESVCDCMTEAVTHAFLIPKPDYELPTQYDSGNSVLDAEIKLALSNYVEAVKPAAEAFGAETAQDRLIIFQDLDVESKSGYVQDEFFEWADFIG